MNQNTDEKMIDKVFMFKDAQKGDKFLTFGGKKFVFKGSHFRDPRFPYKLIDPENPTFERLYTEEGRYYIEEGVISVLDIFGRVPKPTSDFKIKK